MSKRPEKIVLYYPQQREVREGREDQPPVRWEDRIELPLSLLSIAALPKDEGFEVVLIDGTRQSVEEAHARLVKACEGALCYATTGILGHQVIDGLEATRAVKAAHPDLPAIIGGWFASAAPEMQLETGLYDAVALGQGEITFLEFVHALVEGRPLEEVPGLCLRREGKCIRTPARGVVGWDELLDMPWNLIDLEDYLGPQRMDSEGRGVGVGYGPGRPKTEICYFASYGCPLPCTFCSSPGVTGRRWKAMPALRMVEDLAALEARSGFESIEFYDANFGVSEQRVREFAREKIRRGLKFAWRAYFQTASIIAYEESTLDLMAESGLYHVVLGAEAGSDEMLEHVAKNTKAECNELAAVAMGERGVYSMLSYIIGYPGESRESMEATLEQARRIALATPLARPEVWPYLPIPGTVEFDRAVDWGYDAPKSLEEWGLVGDYWDADGMPGAIPSDLLRAKRMFMHYSSLAQGLARQKMGLWERRARRRLERGTFRNAVTEARAFHLLRNLPL